MSCDGTFPCDINSTAACQMHYRQHLQCVTDGRKRTGDAGRAEADLAEMTEDTWLLRLRMAGVIWRLGVTCCMHTSSSGDAQSSLPVSS